MVVLQINKNSVAKNWLEIQYFSLSEATYIKVRKNIFYLCQILFYIVLAVLEAPVFKNYWNVPIGIFPIGISFLVLPHYG